VSRDGNSKRNRIEHGGLFTAPLRRRAGLAGIHVVSQPAFLSVLGDGFLEAFGPVRSRDLYPFASLRDEGVLVAASSDAPVVTAAPLLGMRDAVLRLTDADAPIAAHEAVTVAEALAMYTSRAAFVSQREGELGTLSVGRLADLAIVDRDPLTADPATLPGIRVLRTVVGGRTVFEADGAG
jgi:predicted amidohydrolase YtcJ